jgi:hypothetical protein
MPMIIDLSLEARRTIAGAIAALALWFGGMAALVLFIEPPAVIAVGPSAQLLAAAAGADASLLAVGRGFVTARADQAGLARRLYAGGAWFVWPALPASCGRAK